MNDVKLLLNIIQRDYGKAYMDFYKKHGIQTVFCCLCAGTAIKSMLDYLGIEKTEKLMFLSVVSRENCRKLMYGLITEMGIDVPGSGIAAAIPVASVGGASSMKYLTDGQDIIIGEVKEMGEMPAYALIVVIAEKGYTDMVMDAARSAGAGGGTVVHAKGTGTEFTSKFLGVSIAAEKELIYIVSKNRDKGAIMKAIMEKAGMSSQAHAAVFSLPVEDVAGLRSVMDGEN